MKMRVSESTQSYINHKTYRVDEDLDSSGSKLKLVRTWLRISMDWTYRMDGAAAPMVALAAMLLASQGLARCSRAWRRSASERVEEEAEEEEEEVAAGRESDKGALRAPTRQAGCLSAGTRHGEVVCGILQLQNAKSVCIL